MGDFSNTGLALTEDELLRDEIAVARSNPFFLLRAGLLWIKTKEGELIPLKLNKPQQYILERVLEARRLHKPLRMWVLKFRQGGVSTLIESIIYVLTSQQENRNSLIMGDEEDKSEYLFQMSKLYHERLGETYPHLTPELKKSNAKALEFRDFHSQIIIETAKNIHAARAFTYQYVHLSEVAMFPNLPGVLSGLMQSVPKYWDTFVIGETTANGINEFYQEWKRAEAGQTDWIPLFIPWFWMEEYALSLENGQFYPLEGINFDAYSGMGQFITEEEALRKAYKLSDEQINWRRWAIVNNCHGDINTFREEYPSNADEAFIMSGEQFFDKSGLSKQRTKKPLATGELFQEGLRWQFRTMPEGRIKIYAYPKRENSYVVALDAAEGIPGRDNAAGLVLNKRLNSTAATINGPHTPEELAALGIALGNYYHNATIVPENKGYGYMVCQIVYKNYGNVYRRQTTKDGTAKQTEELGFNTNSVTRPQMLAQLNEEVKNHSTEIVSKELLDEMRTFIVNPKTKKAEAQEGCQDGLVMCRAIAGQVRSLKPHIFAEDFMPLAPETKRQAAYGFRR